MYYEDFYEPSEFDEQVEEWKTTLRESVKKEYQAEMKRLKEENEQLTYIKNNWDKKIEELEKEKDELRRAKREAGYDAKRARLNDLFEPLKMEAWGIKYSYQYLRDKCSKCDKDGYIRYKTPSGKDAREECTCREKILVYEPVEAILSCIRQRNNEKDILFYFQYKRNDYSEEWKFCTTSEIYSGQDYDKINTYSGIIFFDKNECQRYCDYLNDKCRERTS